MARRKPRNREHASDAVNAWADSATAEPNQQIAQDPWTWLANPTPWVQARLRIEAKRAAGLLLVDLAADLWDRL